MVQRKGAKGKKDAKMAGSFADFMAQASKGSVIDLTGREDVFYKTGDFNVDRALGGGIPAGALSAISGQPGAGKSLFALSVCRDVCRKDGRVAYFDTENKISQKAIRMMGFDKYEDENGPLFNHFTIVDNNLEEMIQKIIEFAESGFFQMVVVDSIDTLMADEMEERDIHDTKRMPGGTKAIVWSTFMPAIVSAIERSATDDTERCAVVLVRQLRASMAMYGDPFVSAGGAAVDHAMSCSIRLGSLKSENSEVDGLLVYQGASVRIAKTNQGAVPKDSIPIRLYVGPDKEWGVDPLMSLVDQAIALRIIPPKSATSHVYVGCDELCEMLGSQPGELNFNGKNNLVKAIETDDAFRNAISELVEKRVDFEEDEFAVLEDETDVDFEELDEE